MQIPIDCFRNSSGDIKNIPSTTTFAELQRELKERTGIPLRSQEIIHGFPPKPAVFSVTDTVLSILSNNESIVVREKTSTEPEPVLSTPEKRSKSAKRKDITPSRIEGPTIRTLSDLPSVEEKKRTKKKSKVVEPVVTSSSLSFVGFIKEHMKDCIYLVETYGQPNDLIQMEPWGIGPSLGSFSPFKAVAYSDLLKSRHKGDINRWYVELKPSWILDSSGNDILSDLVQKHHPTPSEIVGKAIVFFKKWTTHSRSNDNVEASKTLNRDVLLSLKPKKARRWDEFCDMPVTFMREILSVFKVDKTGDMVELRKKVLEVIQKRKSLGVNKK